MNDDEFDVVCPCQDPEHCPDIDIGIRETHYALCSECKDRNCDFPALER